MARTYLSGDNSRGGEVTGAGATRAHLRGWTAGVRVQAGRDDQDRDIFRIFRTSGSNGASSDRYIGSVSDTPRGPVFRSRRDEQRLEQRRADREPGPDAARWTPERPAQRQPQRSDRTTRSRGRSR